MGISSGCGKSNACIFPDTIVFVISWTANVNAIQRSGVTI